jgi:DNA processing protein
MRTEGPGRSTALQQRHGLFFLPDSRAAALNEARVDVQTVVAVSMLPVSRLRAAAAFQELRLGLSYGDPLEDVLAACGVPSDAHGALIDEALRRAASALDAAAAANAEPITVLDGRYPPLLSCIRDPPPVLWVRGCLECLTSPAVAVVGSRAATPYALQVAGRLGHELAERGIVVVSGLARGVDSAAHNGCLAVGPTVAVLGSGLDRVYPAEHKPLALNICKTGLLVSELGPGAEPLAEHFPLRNRIISGISLAVVVVEASEKSGSLITASFAAAQGRDVMAVPGSILSGRNRGSHALLKDGAKVVETADDILEELGWPCRLPQRRDVPPKSLISEPLLAQMDEGESYSVEELMVATGAGAPNLLRRLTELELNGLVRSVGGGRFARAERSG